MASHYASHPLPHGWTEYTAPTGQPYYHNTFTQQTTFDRPPPDYQSMSWNGYPSANDYSRQNNGAADDATAEQFLAQYSKQHGNQRGHPQPLYDFQQQRRGPRDPRQDPRHLKDRPKKQYKITGHEPWLIVYTKSKRRFVYNPKSRESLWKIPDHLMNGVLEFDIQRNKGPTVREAEDPSASAQEMAGHAEPLGESLKLAKVPLQPSVAEVDEDGEEVEEHIEEVQEPARVADQATASNDDDEEIIEEIIEEEDDEDGGDPTRDQDTHAEENNSAPVNDNDDLENYELGEEDMAAQLAELEGYEDDAEYGDWDGQENEAVADDEEAAREFESLLDDHGVDPFSTWDNVVSKHAQMIEDERYTLLPNMKARRRIFSQWTSERIAQRRRERVKEAKQDPRIPYLAMLDKHATPKLYWPEFRRKFKKEAEIKDNKLGEKDREKLYREHVNRVTKLSRSQLEADLVALLKSIPVSEDWNRKTSLSHDDPQLPAALLSDVRWISLKQKDRRSILKDFVSRLPRADTVSRGQTTSEGIPTRADKAERAIHERERQVQEQKSAQQAEIRRGQKRLREEEARLEQATDIGRKGLKDSL